MVQSSLPFSEQGNLETSQSGRKMVAESRPAHNSAGGQEGRPERPSGNQGGKTSVELLSNISDN